MERRAVVHNVSTGGLRNEIPLNEVQKAEMLTYALKLGVPEDTIIFSENMNTSYAELFGSEKLYIGTDVLPSQSNGMTANSRVTWKSALAHEILGHRDAALTGNTQSNLIYEEAQASIRAARFAPDISSTERFTLLRDAVERVRSAGLSMRDVKSELWIDNKEINNVLRK